MASSDQSTDALLSALLSKLQVNTPTATATPRIDPELLCKARTQDPYTKKHTAHPCPFRKLIDDSKPYYLKTIEELTVDKLCGQHKKMKERFIHLIIPQLKCQRDYHPLFTTTISTPKHQTAQSSSREAAP